MDYKLIPGYGRERYRIYSDGTVVKEARLKWDGSFTTQKVVKPTTNSTGYLRVSLNLGNGMRYYFIHRLVADAFCEKKEGCNIVNHLDGNKHNNYPSNLEWTTSTGNNRHAFATGLIKPHPKCGEEHWASKFTYAQIKAIREEYIKGDQEHGQCALARKYNTSQALIWDIVNYKTWREMPI